MRTLYTLVSLPNPHKMRQRQIIHAVGQRNELSDERPPTRGKDQSITEVKRTKENHHVLVCECVCVCV